MTIYKQAEQQIQDIEIAYDNICNSSDYVEDMFERACFLYEQRRILITLRLNSDGLSTSLDKAYKVYAKKFESRVNELETIKTELQFIAANND